MSAQVYKQCSRCVMDTTDPAITFNELGECNHCNEYFANTSRRMYQGEETEKALKVLIEKIKDAGKGKAYDCVLGISGGIDSCYAAWVCREMGLRVLCVHMDNGWDSEISVKNIRHIVTKLGFDYESVVLDWEEFKDLQLSFFKASLPELETPTDVAILGALHQVAAKNKVKYIISGGNFATEGILPKSWHYNAKDGKLIRAVQKKFGTRKLRKFPFFGAIQEIYYKYVKGIRIIYLLNYFPYNKKEAMKLLEEKLEWKYYGGKHYESKYTGFVQSYILPVKFNIDYRKATFSTQICTGEITREYALEELKKLPYDPVKIQQEKEYVSKKLGITVEEFDRIMAEPPKTYRDYPNAESSLEFIYQVYRKING